MVLASAGSHGLGKAQLIWRNAAGSGTGVHEASDIGIPVWVKLKRTGTTFSGYYSTDGQSWTLTPPLNASGKLGFGVTSHNNDRITTTVLDHIGLTL